MCAEAATVSYKDIVAIEENESSDEIRDRVIKAHNIQKKRYINETYNYNSNVPSSDIDKYCPLGEEENQFMEDIYDRYALTGRTYYKLLRVARTIADMAGDERINVLHLKESLLYRGLDKKYFENCL